MCENGKEHLVLQLKKIHLFKKKIISSITNLLTFEY